jgi:predicted nucleotidyltransferase
MSRTLKLTEKGLISPPKWLPHNIHYECIMGSVAYGVSTDTSDMDVYGFCIPQKEVVFPHLAGEIQGFGRQKKKFEQYQQHHIQSPDELSGKGRQYDITIYNIVKYFSLCMENNPNMIDSLFVPTEYILHITKIGQMVRENRNLFLHKGSWHKFKGYAYSQVHKMKSKNPIGKRKETVEKFGYDCKFAYHVCRLMAEVEQILSEGTIDLQRNREQLKSIRRGEWSEEQIAEYFTKKEGELETLYVNSKLRHSPDEAAIKQLLLDCLEEHYGSLDNCVKVQERSDVLLGKVAEIIDNWRR